MAKPSFYWHDYETWGVNPRVDRPAQFAGMRTDAELNVVGTPLMMYAQPAMDFLPHPEAVLVTGITPQQASAEGVKEAEFFRDIHYQFRQANTCIVGYNNIRFDDEVTRFGFYRNFIDPYAYSWQNGNSRWDVLDLLRLCHALRPAGINWPQNEKGVTSFKLTDLTAANDIEQLGAHDALVDVRATIAVARLVKQAQPRLFDFYFNLRNKKPVAELINLSRPDILLHVSGMFPAEQGCLAPLFPLIAHPSNANEIICFNLRFNPEALLQLDADQIQKKLYTRSLDLADGEQRIPLKGVHLNKSPALAPSSTLNAQQAEKWQINWDEINHHRDLLISAPELTASLQQAYGMERAYDPVDADSALYQGFIGNEDRLRCNQLLAANPEQLAEWPEDSFHDKRLSTLLFRYRARNFPKTLTDEESQRWRRYCHSKLIDGDFDAGLTTVQFQQQLLTLAQREQGEREQRLLDQLSGWAQEMFS
ncbi:MAG: exodeoxyribonuclease I [Gammaproteobacteria bacterium]|nr:exodeoxyribonuclease I [Gammaproteobacteria bacterium]